MRAGRGRWRPRPPAAVGRLRRHPYLAELDIARRLLAIEEIIEDWVTRYRPTAVAIERVFAQHNMQTVMGTAQAAGVAMLVSARHGIPVSLHTPSEVKASITGSGRAPRNRSAPW